MTRPWILRGALSPAIAFLAYFLSKYLVTRLVSRHNTEENQIYVYDFDVGVELRWDGESVARISLDSRYHGKTKGTNNQ